MLLLISKDIYAFFSFLIDFSSSLLFFSFTFFFFSKETAHRLNNSAAFILAFILLFLFLVSWRVLSHFLWILIAFLVNLFSFLMIQIFIALGFLDVCGPPQIIRRILNGHWKGRRADCIRFSEVSDPKRDKNYWSGTMLKLIASCKFCCLMFSFLFLDS